MLMMLAAAGSPSGPTLTDAELLDRLAVGCDGGAEHLVDHYRAAYPELANFDLLLRIESEQFRIRSLRLVDARARAAHTPAFVYLLTWVWPARAPFGAFHGLDIPLVFGNLEVARSLAGSPAAGRIAAALGQRWTSFAATGTPVGADGVVWPAYTEANRPTLIVDDPLAVELDPYSHDRQAWTGVGTGPSTRPWARVLV
jgi:para-nitrobenzyl esterase